MTQAELNKLLTTYIRRKERADAAYVVFRQNPTASNSSRHMAAVHDVDVLCNDIVAKLAAEGRETPIVNKQQILADIDSYKKCKTCGKELLFPIDDTDFIATSDFLDQFKGVCYTCLSNHCLKIPSCDDCTLVRDPAKCSFKAVKALLQEPV